MADPKKPYGDVTYADPGYQADGKKRYPLDSEEHCRAAWSYINMPKNAAKYTSENLARIKAKIRAALKRYGVEVSEDVKAAAPVVAGSLHGVELARPGTYKLASGEQTFTVDMLHDAARYAARAGARPSPVKIGHVDKRFDGEPAMGWLSNLVVAEDDDGPVLLGDIDDMPDWLTAAAPTAWPNRSVEGWTDYVEDGETYRFVIDGLALLGVTPPGISSIRSLRDLPAALGVAASARVCASFGAPIAPAVEAEDVPTPTSKEAGQMPDPVKLREALGLPADASDDEVRSAVVTAGLAPPTTPPAVAEPAAPVQAALFDAPADDAKPAKVPVAAAGTVVLASSVLDEMHKTIASLTAYVDRSKRNERDQVIADAVKAGKFTPAQRPHFSQLWDADPDGTRKLIDTLTPNSALAVMASGYAGEAEDGEFEREYEALFGQKGASRG